MRHFFNTEIAVLFGDTNVATLFDNLCFWIAHNKANGKNARIVTINGQEVERTFTFNSITAFMKLFPYWSRRQIELYLGKLKEKNLIFKANFNEFGWDRTSWYCLVDERRWLSEYLSRGDEVSEKEPKKQIGDNGSSQEKEFSEPITAPSDEMHITNQRNAYHENVKCISQNGEMEAAKRGNGNHGNGEPIPDINSAAIPPDKKTTAAALEIKQVFAEIDKTLVFDAGFYTAAALFLQKYGQKPEEYVRWLYAKVKKKKPQSVCGYIYRVFCLESWLETFRCREPDPPPLPPSARKICAVCGCEYERDDKCPVCGFSEAKSNDPATVIKYKKILSMDDGTRRMYENELSGAFSRSLNEGRQLKDIQFEIDTKYNLEPEPVPAG